MRVLLLPLLVAGSFLLGFRSPAPAAHDDAALLATFDQVNGFDLETARLGVIRGHNEAVRSLAADVLRDHAMVLQMARDLARNAGITYQVPRDDDGTRSHAVVLRGLEQLSGPAFDAEYLRQEIGFHTGAVQAMKQVLLPGATSPELRALFAAVIPGFEHHLAETREVARGLGVR
jgi:putative membrane protein